MPHQKHACMNNACSHICLLSSNYSYSCACPENMRLHVDKHTCQINEKESQMILGIGKHLVSIPYQTFGRHFNSFADDLDRTIDRMEFNSANGEIFISNDQSKKIFTVDMKKKNMFELVTDHIFSIQSMAYGEFN